ncbi:MAG: hypothetical protein MUC92_13660, partial [Fimbriimonadaceae bacterium]|nr:hypothetical protein [Fimbriimonadaceae bacterium]
MSFGYLARVIAGIALMALLGYQAHPEATPALTFEIVGDQSRPTIAFYAKESSSGSRQPLARHSLPEGVTIRANSTDGGVLRLQGTRGNVPFTLSVGPSPIPGAVRILHTLRQPARPTLVPPLGINLLARSAPGSEVKELIRPDTQIGDPTLNVGGLTAIAALDELTESRPGPTSLFVRKSGNEIGFGTSHDRPVSAIGGEIRLALDLLPAATPNLASLLWRTYGQDRLRSTAPQLSPFNFQTPGVYRLGVTDPAEVRLPDGTVANNRFFEIELNGTPVGGVRNEFMAFGDLSNLARVAHGMKQWGVEQKQSSW